MGPITTDFKELERLIKKDLARANALVFKWQEFARQNPDTLPTDTETLLGRDMEEVINDMGDRDEDEQMQAHGEFDPSKIPVEFLAQTALALAFRNRPKTIEDDKDYQKIAEQQKKLWLEKNPGKDFTSKEGLDYLHGSLEDENAPSLKKDAEEAFRNNPKYRKRLERYDKESKKVYKNPDDDPRIIRTREEIETHIKARHEYLKTHEEDKKPEDVSRIIQKQSWEGFIRRHPEKAKEYGKSNIDIKKAHDKEEIKKQLADLEQKTGRQVRYVEKIHRPQGMGVEEATRRLESIIPSQPRPISPERRTTIPQPVGRRLWPQGRRVGSGVGRLGTRLVTQTGMAVGRAAISGGAALLGWWPILLIILICLAVFLIIMLEGGGLIGGNKPVPTIDCGLDPDDKIFVASDGNTCAQNLAAYYSKQESTTITAKCLDKCVDPVRTKSCDRNASNTCDFPTSSCGATDLAFCVEYTPANAALDRLFDCITGGVGYVGSPLGVNSCGGSIAPTSTPTPNPPACPTLTPAQTLGPYKPPESSVAVDQAVRSAVIAYNLPRWFYYSIIHRESSFDPNAVNTDGGLGLAQLTGADHNGTPYPEYLSTPDNSFPQWRFDMGLNNPDFGPWIDMNNVSILTLPFDPLQNLQRFTSGYAAPAFYLFKTRYGLSDTETLRAVAYHWNHGLPYTTAQNYNPNDTSYLPQYDTYVDLYKPITEAEDGLWSGSPIVSAPPTPTPCPTKAPIPTPTPIPTAGPTPTPGPISSIKIPLIDMGTQNYLGFSGGLYPGASNAVPADHSSEGIARLSKITPRDTTGNPSPTGKIVLLSIGMSNTSREFCDTGSNPTSGVFPHDPCVPESFMGQANADTRVDKMHLVILNGAQGGQCAEFWDTTAENYGRVNNLLGDSGLSEKQVQAIWLKEANCTVSSTLSSGLPSADAYVLEQYLGSILRAAKTVYPNLQMVFVSSRIYTYSTASDRKEPVAYESGFADKWLVEAQINQMRASVIDSRAGDLNYNTVAPWVAWGPYLWADDGNPRSDGLVWLTSDLQLDLIHPSSSGVQKVGNMLLNFFLTSPYTKPWFAP